MASLSTCHLGLWLGWQILLNLVIRVDMGSYPSGHGFLSEWTWVLIRLDMGSYPSGHGFLSEWTWVLIRVDMGSYPRGHGFLSEWTCVLIREDMGSNPCCIFEAWTIYFTRLCLSSVHSFTASKTSTWL